MLYNETHDDVPESPKERNLYYKIFCGCLFNELLPNYKKRVKSFFKELTNKCNNKDEEKGLVLNNKKKGKAIELINEMKSSKKLHVDFDHHIWHIPWIKTDDRGEFADICITDSDNRSLIAIETKYKTPLKYSKDIESNVDRLEEIKKRMPEWEVIYILLIMRNKFEGMKKQVNRKDSFLKKLKTRINDKKGKQNIPIIMMFWEDIKEILNKKEETKVAAKYLEKALNA